MASRRNDRNKGGHDDPYEDTSPTGCGNLWEILCPNLSIGCLREKIYFVTEKWLLKIATAPDWEPS